MQSLPLAIEPPACPAWQLVAGGLHGAAAAIPWLAGCTPGVAALLSLTALAALPWTLAAIPGRFSRVVALRAERGRVSVRLRDGSEVAADVLPSSWAARDGVLLRLSWDGGSAAWWLPRTAVPGDDFRRLKAGIRLAR
ncbi:MAG: hypothetical protein IT483_00315 [Gammaproteobacteria bacterium]|nr:hypothetical protein [Gammaproteobacteria bacterium]